MELGSTNIGKAILEDHQHELDRRRIEAEAEEQQRQEQLAADRLKQEVTERRIEPFLLVNKLIALYNDRSVAQSALDEATIGFSIVCPMRPTKQGVELSLLLKGQAQTELGFAGNTGKIVPEWPVSIWLQLASGDEQTEPKVLGYIKEPLTDSLTSLPTETLGLTDYKHRAADQETVEFIASAIREAAEVAGLYVLPAAEAPVAVQ